jgi:hypothetical protein
VRRFVRHLRVARRLEGDPLEGLGSPRLERRSNACWRRWRARTRWRCATARCSRSSTGRGSA